MTVAEAFDDWYASRREHLARAQDDLVQSAKRFVEDWADEYGFRLEHHDIGAVKSTERLMSKCAARGIDNDFDRLLFDRPPPVGDMCRTRLVFRSRGDVEAFQSAVEQHWPLGDPDIEDLTYAPSETGYRALHLNGIIAVDVRGHELEVPYEVQVKTAAQATWGYYTHDSSYVPTEFNQHPRWGQVRALQQILSDQLHVVDQLQEHIEIVGEEIARDVAAGADPTELMFSNVRAAIQELYAEQCSIGQAQRLVRRARDFDVTTMSAFASRVSPERATAAEIRETFELSRGRPPSAVEIAAELLARGDVE